MLKKGFVGVSFVLVSSLALLRTLHQCKIMRIELLDCTNYFFECYSAMFRSQ